jgi:hypothetical protein
MRALPAVQSASTAAYFERYENSRSHRVNAHPATRHGHYRIALGFTYTFPESRHKRRRASSAFDQPPTGIWSGKGKNVLAIGHNRQVAARRGGVCRKACRAIPRRLVREPGGLRASGSDAGSLRWGNPAAAFPRRLACRLGFYKRVTMPQEPDRHQNAA